MIDKFNDCTFSVVIPLFNKAPHIQNTINSVLEQRYQNFEVIVVDDGSTDGSADIVAAIDDPRIHLVQQENAGVSSARNRGIKLANAEFVAFLDADDLWLPHHLETIDFLIKTYQNCGMYTTSFMMIKEDGNNIKKTILSEPKGRHILLDFDGYLDLITHYTPICTDTICIRKSIFSEIGNFEYGMVRGQDQDMWLRVAAYTHVAFINDITAVYNKNAVNRSPERWSPEWNEGLNRHAAMMKSEEFSPNVRKKLFEYYAKRMIIRGQSALKNGYRSETLQCIFKSYKTREFRIELIKLIIKYFLSFINTNFIIRNIFSCNST